MPEVTRATGIRPREAVRLEVRENVRSRRSEVRMSKKRVTVATTVGLACGVLASVTEVYGFKHPLPPSLLTSIVLSRTVLGFIIGISAWRTSWWWHGMALGVVLNLPLALAVKWAGPAPMKPRPRRPQGICFSCAVEGCIT